MVISCSAFGCTNRQNKRNKLSFHRFPINNPILLKKWIVATKRSNWQPNYSSFLCGDHFTDDCYKSSAKHFLKDDAVPNIFNFTAHLRKQNKMKSLIKKEESQNMPKKCCVPFCRANYCNGPKVSVYSFPKDKDVLQKWLYAIQRKDFQPTKYSAVCESHFKESDFITETSAYDIKTKQTISVPLLVKRLKPKAVPSVFPNYPSHNLSTVEKLIKWSENRKDTNKMSDLSQGTDTNENHSEFYQMTSFYYERLDVESKEKYLDKLTFNGIILPDPLDSELRLRLFKPRNFNISPNITFGDIYLFLVETENVYSREDFKNYKNLDCYKLIMQGKVQDILAYKCDDSKMCILTCDIQDSEIITKLHRPWTVVSCDGVIQCGHCTCMEGLGKVCSHVSALLLSLEIAVRKDIRYHSRTENSEEIPLEKSNCIPISGDSGQNIMASSFTPSPPTMPSRDTYKKFLSEIKKIVPNAAIFTTVSDSDLSDSDEDAQNNSNNVISNMHKITVMNHVN